MPTSIDQIRIYFLFLIKNFGLIEVSYVAYYIGKADLLFIKQSMKQTIIH